MAANTVKMPTKKLILPPALGSYVHLFEPKPNLNGKPKYSMALLWDKSVDLSEVKRTILDLAVQAFGPQLPPKMAANPDEVRKVIAEQLKSGKLKYPLHDGDVDRPEDEAYANKVYCNVSSGTKPGVVDAQVKEVFETTECYSGCTFRVSVTVAAFSNEAKGVAIYLNNVQVVKKGPRIDGRADAAKEFAEFAEVGGATAGNDAALAGLL